MTVTTAGPSRQTAWLCFSVTTSMQMYDLSDVWVWFWAHIYSLKVCECLHAHGWGGVDWNLEMYSQESLWHLIQVLRWIDKVHEPCSQWIKWFRRVFSIGTQTLIVSLKIGHHALWANMNIQEPLWQKLNHNMRSKHNKQFRDTFFFSVMLLIVHSKLYFKTDIWKRKPHGVMQQFGGHFGPCFEL